MSLNIVTLVGNLGRDAEVRYTSGGTAVANFSIATSEVWRDKTTNEKKEQTDWHRIVLWGKAAESLQQYLVKGKTVAITGSIHNREWEDRDGNKRYTTEIKARDVRLVGGGGGRRDDHDQRREETAAPEPPELTEEDIPF
jgi:single-strand DNA-binding protein